MVLEESGEKIDGETECGFEEEINQLIDTRTFFINEWKITYKSMEPKEIVHFLNHWAEEIYNLKNKTTPDSLSKGIISNILFKRLVKEYPGYLISKNLKENLLKKMDEKINPFKIFQKKIERFLEEGKEKEITNEISIFFNSYINYTGNKDFLNKFMDKLLPNLIMTIQEKKASPKVISSFIQSYLD
ncbi:MAG: hypothetical protein ACTSO9_07550, partial [Candidatus Helarchaeota archaeon]